MYAIHDRYISFAGNAYGLAIRFDQATFSTAGFNKIKESLIKENRVTAYAQQFSTLTFYYAAIFS